MYCDPSGHFSWLEFGLATTISSGLSVAEYGVMNMLADYVDSKLGTTYSSQFSVKGYFLALLFGSISGAVGYIISVGFASVFGTMPLAGKIMGIVDLVLLAFCCTIAGLYLEETNHSEESQEFCFFLGGVFISIGTRGMFSTMGFSKSTCEFSGDTSSFLYDLYTVFK